MTTGDESRQDRQQLVNGGFECLEDRPPCLSTILTLGPPQITSSKGPPTLLSWISRPPFSVEGWCHALRRNFKVFLSLSSRVICSTLNFFLLAMAETPYRHLPLCTQLPVRKSSNHRLTTTVRQSLKAACSCNKGIVRFLLLFSFTSLNKQLKMPFRSNHVTPPKYKQGIINTI